jgi:flagellar basal body-associated protein FliL
MAPSENVNEKVKKGFFAKKKGLKIAGIVVLAILMLGGVVGALVVQSIKNQPPEPNPQADYHQP